MQKVKLSAARRKFLKELGSGALVAAVGTATSERNASAQAAPEWSATFDWICVGSGVGALGAAFRGQDLGMKTLVLEKTDMIGGISSQVNAGGYCAVNRWQKAAGIQDTRESGLTYLRHVGGGYASEAHMEAYVDNGARVMEYISDKEGIEFGMSSSITAEGGGFYAPVLHQATALGRRIAPIKPFHAPAMGPWRDKVRQPPYLRGFFEALGAKDAGSGGPFRTSERQLEVWKKRLGEAKVEALLQENEEYREGGAGWMCYLLQALLKRGGEARTEAEVERLVVENGRVIGVVVNQKGRTENFRVNKGVLLALGNKMLGMDSDWGESWRLAAEVGAKINSEAQVITMATLNVPGELYPNGKAVGRLGVGGYRFIPHSIVVNWYGERFDNEAWYSGTGRVANHFEDLPSHRFRNFPNYLIFDQQLLEKYSLAGMPPGHLEPQDWEWLTQSRTQAELARKLDISAKGLEATVARFNEFARQGKDQDFNRNAKTLAPLEKPPFYGVRTHTPDPFATTTTVVTNPHAQVLHYKTENPIPGLYCCGGLSTQARIFGVGYQGGLQVGAGATFGFLAAEHAKTA